MRQDTMGRPARFRSSGTGSRLLGILMGGSARPRNLGMLILLAFALLFIAFAAHYGGRGWRVISKRLMGPPRVGNAHVPDDGSFTNIIFLHHSTGRALIREGQVREGLAAKGYQFWDHDYNWEGLTGPDGASTHTHYDIPEVAQGTDSGGNTDPEGLLKLFSQDAHRPPHNAFSRLLQHRIILFKSCFPNSAIESDERLEVLKSMYREIRGTIDRHPDHLFILLTTPPLHPDATRQADAARAYALSRWLQSDEFLKGHPNLRVFDFYGLLADPASHTLKAEYRPDDGRVDSHPNSRANAFIGPQLVGFVDGCVKAYRERSAHPAVEGQAP